MRPDGISDLPIVFVLLTGLDFGEAIMVLLRTVCDILSFQICDILNNLRYEYFLMVGMDLGGAQFNTLELFTLANRTLYNLILIDIYHNVGPCLRIIKKQLVRCASYKPTVLVKNIKLAQVEDWNEMAVLIEYVQGKAKLAIGQMLAKNRFGLGILKRKKALE